MLPASSAPTPIPALTAAWTAWTLLLWKAIRHARPRRLRASRTGARHWHGWENITSGSGSVRGSSEAAAVQKKGDPAPPPDGVLAHHRRVAEHQVHAALIGERAQRRRGPDDNLQLDPRVQGGDVGEGGGQGGHREVFEEAQHARPVRCVPAPADRRARLVVQREDPLHVGEHRLAGRG